MSRDSVMRLDVGSTSQLCRETILRENDPLLYRESRDDLGMNSSDPVEFTGRTSNVHLFFAIAT